MTTGLVGSEMCIRDSPSPSLSPLPLSLPPLSLSCRWCELLLSSLINNAASARCLPERPPGGGVPSQTVSDCRNVRRKSLRPRTSTAGPTALGVCNGRCRCCRVVVVAAVVVGGVVVVVVHTEVAWVITYASQRNCRGEMREEKRGRGRREGGKKEKKNKERKNNMKITVS